MDARLAFAIELEQRDAAVAARLAELATLGDAVERVRGRVAGLDGFLERLPAERALLASQAGEVKRVIAQLRVDEADAAAAVERARGGDAREAARQVQARAAADVRGAEERLDRLARRRAALEHEAERSTVETDEVERDAARLAGLLAALPRVSRIDAPGMGLGGLAEWGARAHAAVLVVRAGLETERERIGREANELASSALGEPLYAASVALVRRRLESELS